MLLVFVAGVDDDDDVLIAVAVVVAAAVAATTLVISSFDAFFCDINLESCKKIRPFFRMANP